MGNTRSELINKFLNEEIDLDELIILLKEGDYDKSE